MHINIRELARRENEQTEWKENVADYTNVVKTIVAFANDYANLGGGYVICGVREIKDEYGFQKIEMPGLEAGRIRELEGRILTECRTRVDPPIIPRVDTLPSDDQARRLLVFTVPASPRAHCYRSPKGDAPAYYVRVSHNTMEARNGVFRELLVQKNDMVPWDRRRNDHAKQQHIDALLLRDILQELNLWKEQSMEELFSCSLHAMVPPLSETPPLMRESVPRNFALLLFGKQPTDFFPGAYAIFSIYPGEDRGSDLAERVEVMGSLIVQARKLIDLLNVQSYTAYDKTSDHPNQIKYPKRALQEAVINALVHRDYEMDQPTRITVFSNRVEINSPGGLHRTIDPEKFKQGKASAHWRNQTLSWIFNRLQLAQSEGQGIPTILRTMKEEGCPAPSFEVNTDNLICILPAHPRHKVMDMLRQIENRMIHGENDKAMGLAHDLLDQDPYNYRGLELFCELCNLLGKPEHVYYFLEERGLDPARVNVGTVSLVARTLTSIQDKPHVRQMAHRWMEAASARHLKGVELKRLVLNYRRMGADEAAIELIDRYLLGSEQTNIDANLLEIRAKAKIDLAKKCMETGRNRKLKPALKSKAWARCRAYLDEAEEDLVRARDIVTRPQDREYIIKDLEFLGIMKDMAKKPSPRKNRQQ